LTQEPAEVVFAKVDGRWYFAERDLILDWSETRMLRR
jgi:hypothetical protein